MSCEISIAFGETTIATSELTADAKFSSRWRSPTLSRMTSTKRPSSVKSMTGLSRAANPQVIFCFKRLIYASIFKLLFRIFIQKGLFTLAFSSDIFAFFIQNGLFTLAFPSYVLVWFMKFNNSEKISSWLAILRQIELKSEILTKVTF